MLGAGAAPDDDDDDDKGGKRQPPPTPQEGYIPPPTPQEVLPPIVPHHVQPHQPNGDAEHPPYEIVVSICHTEQA